MVYIGCKLRKYIILLNKTHIPWINYRNYKINNNIKQMLENLGKQACGNSIYVCQARTCSN